MKKVFTQKWNNFPLLTYRGLQYRILHYRDTLGNDKLVSRSATYNVEIVLEMEAGMNLTVLVAAKKCSKGEYLGNYQIQ